VAARAPAAFTFESRPEFVTQAAVRQVRDVLGDAALACHLGVESWDDDIRTTCHLKSSRRQAYVEAVSLLSDERVASIANIALGGLGLSPREAYRDARSSIAGTRAAGFTIQMLFPLCAKRGTLLGWAETAGLWSPPPLWMLIFLLAESGLPDRGVDDLDVSWYNPPISAVVRRRPDGCEECRPALVETLDRFRTEPSLSRIESMLDWRRCDCPIRARELMHRDEVGTWAERLADIARAREGSR